MSSARLYAVEISGVIVTVRAEVVVPSRAERADGDDQTWVDFDAVNGVRIQEFTCELSDAEWRVLEEAVIDADRAARNLAQAEEHDAASWIDEPIDYTVVDQPAEYDGIDRAPEDTSDLWESCFGSDPEAPHVCLDDDAINAFAIEQSPTRRVLRALDRAAGGAS